MSSMKDIVLRTPEQLGAAIRLMRKEKGLTQSGLAALLGAGLAFFAISSPR